MLVSTARKICSCDDFFGVLQLLHSFFSVSAKRHHQYIQTQKEHGEKPLEIPGLRDTRWACRFQCVRVVKMRIESVIKALEDIRENSNDGIERAQVMGILAQVGCWDFIFHLCLFFKVLGIINGVSEALQSDSIDLAAAMNLVSATLRTLVDCRSDEEYQIIFDNTMEIATSLAIPTSRQSRRVRTQSTRLRDMVVLESTGDHSVEGDEETANRLVYFAVIDKFIGELKLRFNDSKNILLAIAACCPKATNFLDLVTLKPLIEQYSLDLCKLENELPVAKAAISNAKESDKMELQEITDLVQFLIPMRVAFTELLKLLQLALTIPVTTASCERSFSSLKRIKSYLRSRMGQERLSFLAVLAIEREADIDLDKVIDIFAQKNRSIPLKVYKV